MNEKRFRDKVDQELRFTQEDRNKVFEKINKREKNNKQEKIISFSEKLAPLTASLLVVGLCIFLFMPSILPGNANNNNAGSHTSGVISHEDDYFTALFTVKDKTNRIPINLLLTFSKDKKMMNVITIPRDTYAPILDKDDGTVSYGKLTFAYGDGSGGAERVRTTVSKLFDISIDYYAVMDLETFSSMINSVNGIEYELEEDIRVSAISQAVFELKKGTHRLNGEEVLALMMDAAYGRSMDEEDQANLMHAVMDKTINVLPQTQLKQFTSKIEGNIPFEQLLKNKMEIPSIDSLSLREGMIDSMIDETYYLKFERGFLHSVSEELTTFN